MARQRITPTGWVRIGMLATIAVVCLASAVGWSDPDLWLPFVCIIAVMGVGTRGGVLDALPTVLIEASVVVMLGVATFSNSRDFIWAASVAVSLVAVGKIALLELTKDHADEEPRARRGEARHDPAPAASSVAASSVAAPSSVPSESPARRAASSSTEPPLPQLARDEAEVAPAFVEAAQDEALEPPVGGTGEASSIRAREAVGTPRSRASRRRERAAVEPDEGDDARARITKVRASSIPPPV